jgi:hypothetical protein
MTGLRLTEVLTKRALFLTSLWSVCQQVVQYHTATGLQAKHVVSETILFWLLTARTIVRNTGALEESRGLPANVDGVKTRFCFDQHSPWNHANLHLQLVIFLSPLPSVSPPPLETSVHFQARSLSREKRLLASSCLSVCQCGTTRLPLDAFLRNFI